MNPQQPLPAGHLEIRPELRLAHQRQMLAQQQQQQAQQHQRFSSDIRPDLGFPHQQYPGMPPHHQQQIFPSDIRPEMRFQHQQYPMMQHPHHQQFPSDMRPEHRFQHHQYPLMPQQQPQQPVQREPIELQMNQPNSNLPVHLAKIPIQFPGPGPSEEQESTVKSEWIEKITRLTPRPLFHPNLLDGLSAKSVGFLCGIGKDVVQELVIRMLSITTILKVPNWKTAAFAEVELLLSYCKFLIEKIREIRAHIDRKTISNTKLSTNDFIELMALPTPPKLPKNIEELRNTYLGNESFLFRVSNAFKKVEWLGENADPRNASLCFKDEISRITAAEDARRQPTSSTQKKA